MILGTLKLVSVDEGKSLLGAPVGALLEGAREDVAVAAIDASLSDTRAFCEHYQVPLDQAANCVVLDVRRKNGEVEERFLAACVVLATTRIDVNGKVREVFGAKKASFAQMEKAVEESQMEYGAITPVGLPSTWPLLIDRAVAESPGPLVIGGGLRSSKLVVSGAFLASLPGVRVIEGLGRLVDPTPVE